MGTEESKRIAIEFIENESNGKLDKVFDALAEDSTWTIMGYSEMSDIPCTRTKQEVKTLFQDLQEMFPEGLRTTVKGVTAEGNRVALETETYGKTSKGRIYNNFYHMLFEIRNGKIQSIREYCDINYAQRILID